MSVSVTYATTLTIAETLATNVPAATAANRVVTHNQFNKNVTLTGATSPPVTTCANFNKAMSGGAATVDLTALTGTNGATVDGTGLKVQCMKVSAPASNANAITLKFGASNPYNLLGSAFQVQLSPGQEIQIFGDDDTPDIASNAKNLDMAGTGTQSLDFAIVMG